MPKIEVYKDAFYFYAGKEFTLEELEEILPCAKAELDGADEDEGILKIELNDTNRPDLWSTAGLGRQLAVYSGKAIPQYDFFSTADKTMDWGGRTVTVDPGLENIRPYIVAFAITGKNLDEPTLKDIIQTQEKLCWNFGQKRKSIAMGVYRSDILKYPVRYTAADPDATSFIPLGMEKELSLRQILTEHPKGEDFGWIVKDLPKFPFLQDDRGDVLSFPPVINSARIGAAKIGDENLFVEMTGTDLYTLLVAASIVACDCADTGFTVLPVKVEYPYDTPLGRDIVCPYYFQEPVSLDVHYANKLLGENLTAREAGQYIEKVGSRVDISGEKLILHPPEYRNDFLHPVDVVEDIMIGKGMEGFEPVMPTDFTVGRYTPAEERSRTVKNIMLGLGFQEMVYNYLGSGKDYKEKMNISGDDVIRISNPMSENYEYVRPSVLPSLLASESVSGNAVYPHALFEVGKVAVLAEEENYGTRTENHLGFCTADREAGFTLINSHISAIFFYMNLEYEIEELDDPRFIRGRSCALKAGGRKVGFFGEVHPAVLENWGIQMPCTAGEINLDAL